MEQHLIRCDIILKNGVRQWSSYFLKDLLHYFEKYNRFTIENAAFFREHAINMTLEKKKNGYNVKI